MTPSFFDILWMSMALTAIGSMGVFFGRCWIIQAFGGALALSGITLTLLNVDIFRMTQTGAVIASALWILFTALSIWGLKLLNIKKTKTKLPPAFFGLPFLAFITMAVSMDLLTLLLGISLFVMAFLMMSALRGKTANLFTALQRASVAFLGYAYGMAILFSREGTIAFEPLRLKLSKGDWDSWTALGIGLIVLSIAIQMYIIVPLVGPSKTK